MSPLTTTPLQEQVMDHSYDFWKSVFPVAFVHYKLVNYVIVSPARI